MSRFETRVLWEGEILESTDHGDHEHIANAHYSSTVDKYNRTDPIDGGVLVQLLNGEDVEYERLID